MFDASYRITLSDNHYMCISTLDKDVLDASTVDGIGDDFGYFIYEETGPRHNRCIEVLAKFTTYEAALRLLDFLTPQAAAA